MEQLTHYTTQFESKQFPITVICDSVYFQDNIGSIFRICDAFGVSKIIFSGEYFVFSERKINKTSRSTHKHLAYEIIKEQEDLIAYIQKADAQVVAIEITSTSQPLHELKLMPNQALLLIIGNEIHGISEEVLKTTTTHTHITMFGKNSSMNVVQSLSIALYEITKGF